MSQVSRERSRLQIRKAVEVEIDSIELKFHPTKWLCKNVRNLFGGSNEFKICFSY